MGHCQMGKRVHSKQSAKGQGQMGRQKDSKQPKKTEEEMGQGHMGSKQLEKTEKDGPMGWGESFKSPITGEIERSERSRLFKGVFSLALSRPRERIEVEEQKTINASKTE